MLRTLVDFLFPPQCASCDGPGSGLCERCAPLEDEPHVRRLATLSVRALGAYCGAYRHAILALKDGRRDVADALAARMAQLVTPRMPLLAVTTTAARRRARGMDNVAFLTERLAVHSQTHAVRGLQRTGTDTQRGRLREARLAAQGRFACDPLLVRGRSFVLVDDVCTTGATLEDCAKAVRACGGCIEEAVVVALA